MLEGYGGWYEDFWELSTERQIGMAEGEIPASVIARHTAGWSWEDAEAFAYCMRAMDRIYLRRGEDDQTEAQVSARDAFRVGTSSKRGR